MGEPILATCSECVKVWNLPEEAPVATFAPHKKTINCLRWTGHTKCVATASDDGTVTVSKKSGGVILTLGPTRSPVKCIAFLPGKKLLASGGSDRTLRLWSVSDGKLASSLSSHADAITCVDAATVGDAQFVASGDESGVAVVHNAANWSMSRTLLSPDSQPLRALVYDRHRRDQALLLATAGGLVAEWDLLGKGTPLWAVKAHQAACTAVAQSPVSRSLVASVGLDKHLALISPGEQKVIKSLAMEAPLTALDFNSDGHTIAIGTQNGQVLIYDLRSSTQPRTHVLKAHSPNPVNYLAFLRGQQSVASSTATGKQDRDIRTATGQRPTAAAAAAAATATATTASPSPTPADIAASPSPQTRPVSPPETTVQMPPTVIATAAPITQQTQAQAPPVGQRTSTPQHVSAAAAELLQRIKTPVVAPVPQQPQQPTPEIVQQSSATARAVPPATTLPTATTTASALPATSSAFASFAADVHRLRTSATAQSEAPQQEQSPQPAAAAVKPPTAAPSGVAAQVSALPTPGDMQAAITKKLIEDAQFEFREQMHNDIINLHVDMIRGFAALKAEMAEMLNQHLGTVREIMRENQELREEIRSLRNLR